MSVCAAANVEASNNAGVVVPRVEFHDGVEGTELEATVRDDSCFGPYFGNIILTESLKDKLKACVGKYRMQFVKDSREDRGALLAVNARETIFDVARHRSVPDLRIGILGLKHKLDALDGRGERLRNGTRDSCKEEIGSYSENCDKSHTDLHKTPSLQRDPIASRLLFGVHPIPHSGRKGQAPD